MFNFRQCRILLFTIRRERLKCREHGDVSEEERKRRQRNAEYSDYWQKRLDAEECTAAFQTAISTLVEDASEITLALYVIISQGEYESIIGQLRLVH